MSRVRRVLEAAIDTTAESFLEQPANYSDERSLAEDVRSRICSELTPASVEAVSVEESSKAQGSIPDHEAYTGRYRDTEEIDRAQCEIGGPAFPFGGTERLDLGVFSNGLTITVDNGTQEFDPSDLVAAVEFKYVKNINYLRYRPNDDKSKYRDIADDIYRLGELPDDVDRRCVVFSNYDMLRRKSDNDAERNLRELAEKNDVGLRLVLPEPRPDI
jgi:hypothetical protein